MLRIVLYCSKKLIQQEEALAIFATGMSNQIRLELEWIPREENESLPITEVEYLTMMTGC